MSSVITPSKSRLTVTEAARLAGISRTWLYKLRDNGKLTIGTDAAGRSFIDAAEWVRCFEHSERARRPEPAPEPKVEAEEFYDAAPEIAALRELIAELQHAIADARADKLRLQTLMEAQQAQIARLMEAVVTTRPVGLLGWLRGR